MNDTLVIIIQIATVVAAIAYATSLAYVNNRKAVSEVGAEADKEADRFISMLKDANGFLGERVDVLTARVETLTGVVLEMACKNAPTCKNRVKPDACLDCVIRG